jgi:diadenosine tetraphosphate (Ap4A) HIT family hydrolase
MGVNAFLRVDECTFCSELVINRMRFYEDTNFNAIYNLRPVVPGHCMVVPKRHVKTTFDLNAEERSTLASFINRAIFIALKYARAYSFNMMLQVGEASGQSIEHLHFHLMPRKPDDKFNEGGGDWYHAFQREEHRRDALTNEEIKTIIGELRAIADRHEMQLGTL